MAKTSASRGTFIQQSRQESPEQKAIYHQVTGAGKGRVKREFFDLSATDEHVLADKLDALIGKRLSSQSGV